MKEFSERGYTVVEEEHFSNLKHFNFQYAVVDLRLGTENGLAAVKAILQNNPACKLVVLTGYGSVATAVEAIKLGAVNYLTKPVSIEILEKALLGELKSTEVPEEMQPLSKHEHEYIEFVLTQKILNCLNLQHS